MLVTGDRKATDNRAWGRRRLRGELAKPAHLIAACTVWQILYAVGTGSRPAAPA